MCHARQALRRKQDVGGGDGGDDAKARAAEALVARLKPTRQPNPRRPWWVLHPRDGLAARWDAVVFVALLYVAVVTPFEIAVMRGRGVGRSLTLVNYTFDGIFGVDVREQNNADGRNTNARSSRETSSLC